jgi:hypothetical protein
MAKKGETKPSPGGKWLLVLEYPTGTFLARPSPELCSTREIRKVMGCGAGGFRPKMQMRNENRLSKT